MGDVTFRIRDAIITFTNERVVYVPESLQFFIPHLTPLVQAPEPERVPYCGSLIFQGLCRKNQP